MNKITIIKAGGGYIAKLGEAGLSEYAFTDTKKLLEFVEAYVTTGKILPQ